MVKNLLLFLDLAKALLGMVDRISLRHKLRMDSIVVFLGTTNFLEVTCVPSARRDEPDSNSRY